METAAEMGLEIDGSVNETKKRLEKCTINMNEEEKDIVVTTPAPINNQTASSAGTDNQNTNASVGYTYTD